MVKLEYFEYMTIPLALFAQWIIEQYDLNVHVLNGKVHLELRCGVWGSPQAEILANKRLRQKMAPFGYHECLNMPGLWYYDSHPILFTLVVDNFGVKYINNNDMKQLIRNRKLEDDVS
jgi:hypothetical protein